MPWGEGSEGKGAVACRERGGIGVRGKEKKRKRGEKVGGGWGEEGG